jgi:hypothetical protein
MPSGSGKKKKKKISFLKVNMSSNPRNIEICLFFSTVSHLGTFEDSSTNQKSLLPCSSVSDPFLKMTGAALTGSWGKLACVVS